MHALVHLWFWPKRDRALSHSARKKNSTACSRFALLKTTAHLLSVGAQQTRLKIATPPVDGSATPTLVAEQSLRCLWEAMSHAGRPNGPAAEQGAEGEEDEYSMGASAHHSEEVPGGVPD